jgi:hypothetical protein
MIQFPAACPSAGCVCEKVGVDGGGGGGGVVVGKKRESGDY